jgi:methyl-accepting chemotaxis protein
MKTSADGVGDCRSRRQSVLVGEDTMVGKFDLKVGHKLAIGSVTGIVLVVGLVATTLGLVGEIGSTTKGLLKSGQTVDRMAESKRAYVEMRALYRDAVTAPNVETVDKTVATFGVVTTRLGELLAAAETDARDATEKERMSQERVLLAGYFKGWNEAVAHHRDTILARNRLLDTADRMYRASDELRRLLKQAADDRRSMTLERANGNFYLAGGKIWRLFVTGDVGQADTAIKAVDQTIADLRGIGDHPDRAIATVAATAVSAMEEMRAIAGEAARSVGMRDTTAGKTVPIREESNRIIDQALSATAEVNAAQYRVVDEAISSARYSAIGFSVLAVIVMIGSAVFGSRAVGRPIGRIAGVLERLAEGDRAIEVPFVDRRDEVGEAARAAAVFKENLIRLDQMAQQQKQADERAEAEKRKTLVQIADGFETTVGGIVESVATAAAQLQRAAETMSASAEQTNGQSSAVAAASEEASANVRTVAASAEELAASVGEIGRRVNESAEIAGNAAHDAETTAAKVARLSDSARRIGDVVGLISTIASQTNLLALNATIEAARAGEAGKGFAVVASEVKSLADQTSKATADIARQVEEIQASTAESTTAIGAITETIGRMNAIATAIAASVEEQGTATQEIARNVQQASSGTTEVSTNIVGVTRAAADASTASAQVLTAASELSRQSARLRGELDGFLRRVRAA